MLNQPLILIVDDEQAIVAALQYRLRAAGYRAIGSFAGREGVETARRTAPDLILLDYCLPQMHGATVLSELRRDPRTCGIPVVMLSGAEMRQQDAIAAGAVAFLRKPYRKDDLLDLVESLLAHSQTTDGCQS